MMTPQAPQPTYTSEELMKWRLPQLKMLAAQLGTPVTGAKPKLIEYILNPASNQKKNKASGDTKKRVGIVKKKKKKPKTVGYRIMSGMMAGEYDDDDECEAECEMCGESSDCLDEMGNCEDCEGKGYCLRCDEPGDLFRGECSACMDTAVQHNGVCPGCMKRSPPCAFCPYEGSYECCM